jgi:hypothetical protein
MTGTVSNLGEHRQARSGDGRDWSPADVLRLALAEIDAGRLDPTMLFIAAKLPDDANGNGRLWYAQAGADKLQAVGLLHQHAHELLMLREVVD